MSLLSRKLIVIAGKGGVGRTTTAIALALAAARQGLYTAVLELNGASGVPELWGFSGRDYAPRSLAPNVDTISMSALDTLDDFGIRRLKLDALVRVLFHNRVMDAFLDAVPGLHDLIQLGKVNSLLHENYPQDPKYDLIVLDAPATGHGLTLLGAARNMADMTRVGPFYEEARRIEAILADPEHTALVIVTLPEELPVNETLQLAGALGPDQDLLCAVVVNKVLPNPLPPGVAWPRMREVLAASDHPAVPPLLSLADRTAERHRDQYHAFRRLSEELPHVIGREVPIGRLHRVPHVPTRNDLAQLGEQLDAILTRASPDTEEVA